MTEQWITYFREHHSSGVETAFTRLASEDAPKRTHWNQRPATEEEIADEKAKREQKKREEEALATFRARPEYIAAMAIRNRLEWITPEDHPLDALTLAEWKELQKKLGAN